ncbi:MAG TPA: type IV secretion system protein [Allosphingosinicella sp.]|jgi:type IV secretion system protein VirB6
MMAAACQTFGPGGPFLRQMLATIDCQAQTIGEGGYQALTSPGSPASLLLAGALTIFVAVFGYRLLFGRTPTAWDAVAAVAKVGVVLALATSWPAFRTVIYDVALRGPAELVSSIGQPVGLPGADGSFAVRLQGVDDMLAELLLIGTGRPPSEDLIAGPGPALTEQQQQQQLARIEQLQQRPRWNQADDVKMLRQARTLYLAGAIGAFASVRLIAGLLLALAPLFALFLLFDATRGLFEGWLRGLLGTAVGATGVAIVLGVQLALLGPWMATVLATRHAAISTPSVPVELLVMTLVFALVLLATLAASARLAYTISIPHAWRALPSRLGDVVRTQSFAPAGVPRQTATDAQERSRALQIADAVASLQRREAASPGAARTAAGPAGRSAAGTPHRLRTGPAEGPASAGRSPGAVDRRTRGRISGVAIRRDGAP